MSNEPIAELETLTHPDAAPEGTSSTWGSEALWEELSLGSVWLGAGDGPWGARN